MKKKKIIILTIIIPLVVVLALIDWGRMYRYDTDIDLNTGAIRNRYFFWIVPIRSETVNTRFSDLVSKYIKEEKEPNWDVEVITGDWKSTFSVGGKRLFACDMFVTSVNLSHLDPGDKYLDTAKEEEFVMEALSYLKQGKAEEIKNLANNIIKEYVKEGVGFF